jgi:hypothetical protein
MKQMFYKKLIAPVEENRLGMNAGRPAEDVPCLP